MAAADEEFDKLAQLVIQGDYDQLCLLATQPMVTATNSHGRSGLMLVADALETPSKSEKCILYLLKLDASSIVLDKRNETVAHVAARRDHLRILMLLPFNAKWLLDWQGATPLMIAALAGSWRCAKHLLHLLRQIRHNNKNNDRRLQLLELKDVEGRVASDLARQSGHSELASYIEREMRLVVNRHGQITGLTDLEETERGRLERLIEAGDSAGLRQAATRVSCDLPDQRGVTPVMRALSKCGHFGDEVLWRELSRFADPTCADKDSFSCMHYAAVSSNLVAITTLADAGASANARDQFESTPLIAAARCAASSSSAAVGRALLAQGSDWSLRDRKERTALDHARKKELPELVELLRRLEDCSYFDSPELILQLINTFSFPFVSRWTQSRLIGRGGYGEVHEANTDREIRCAVKTLRLPVQQHGTDQQRSVTDNIDRAIAGEWNLCRLQHDNIVRFFYFHVQWEPLTVSVFMELLDGRSLENVINAQRMEEETIRLFCVQICSALRYLHSRQPPVIHRDVKCSNIIVLSDNKRVKLIDFGLSIKLKQSVSHLTASTELPKGTLHILAPELLVPDDKGNARYSRRSDIWAFGCSVYQMAAGALPHASFNDFLRLAIVVQKKGAPAVPKDCSAELKHFYKCCTRRTPKKRSSAMELMEHAFLTGETTRRHALRFGRN